MTEPTIKERINNYLGNGGLWNPEAIEHDKVRTLLIDCRDYLAALDAQPVPVEPDLGWLYTHCKAIGMDCKSDSGKMAEDIALFTINLQSALQRAQEELHIVFDGPPAHESGRFVEVETASGKSIKAGEWEQRGEYWHLIIGGRK